MTPDIWWELEVLRREAFAEEKQRKRKDRKGDGRGIEYLAVGCARHRMNRKETPTKEKEERE